MIEFPQVQNLDGNSVKTMQDLSESAGISIVYFERNGDAMNVTGSKSEIIRVIDPEIQAENLAEMKHHKLARARRTGQSEKDLKPNAETRNRLNDIISYPNTQTLSSEEKDLVWQYRFYLSANKKALAKFVKCVDWNTKTEANQALDLLHRWHPMDVEDALELLGPSFKHPGVRKYAVGRMRSSPDNDLQLYLLQLVQALKYEKFSTNTTKNKIIEDGSLSSSQDLNNASSTHSSLPPATMQVSRDSVEMDSANPTEDNHELDDESSVSGANGGSDSGLAQFLIERASRNSVIANYFYWYLVIECETDQEDAAAARKDNERIRTMYESVLKRFKSTLKAGPQDYRDRATFLKRQHTFVQNLVGLVKAVARENGNRSKKN